MNDQATKVTAENPKLTKGQIAFLVFAFLMLLGWLFGEPSYEIQDGKASISTKVWMSSSLDMVASQVLGDVYTVVHKNPDLQALDVTLYILGAGLTDRYGTPLKHDIKVGVLHWDRARIEDALKYKKDYAYSQDEPQKIIIMAMVRSMTSTYFQSH